MYRIHWILLFVLVLTPLLAIPTAAGELSQPDKPDLILTTDGSGVMLDLDLPAYRIENVLHEGVLYQQLAVDGDGWWPAGQPGGPSLPERGLMLAVPPTGDVTVQVLEAQAQRLDGSFQLAPKPTGVLVEAGDESRVVEQWIPDPAAYAAESWTPVSQAEITEEGWMRGYRFVRVALRPFQFNPASGELQAAPTMRVRVSFAEPAPAIPAPADPLFAPIFQATFDNYEQAAGWQTRPEAQAMPAWAETLLRSNDPWVKVTVNADGLYRVTYADLQSAGVTTAVLNTLNPRTFRLLDAGQEQHIHVVGEGDNVFHPADSIVFYGQRNTHPHSSNDNVYWLTWGGVNGLRMAVQDATPGGAPFAATLLTTAHAEENLEYKQQRPFTDWLQPVLYDHWYAGQVVNPRIVTFPGLKVNTASAVAPTLSVWMAGDKQNPGSYNVEFTLNSSATQSRNWINTRVLEASIVMPAGALVSGDNTVEVRPVNVFNLPYLDYTVWLDWLRLTYPYSGEYLAGATFNNPDSGQWRYQISQAPSTPAWVVNVGAPTQPKLLSNVATSGSGPYTLTWQQSTTPSDRFLVTPDAAVRQPVAVTLWQGSTLLETNQQVDYLMIAHPSLISAVQPLAAMHSANGLSVHIANVQEIYDLFSDGSLSADAIRSYLAYAYSSYPAPAPTYVLLVGDGTVNYRGYTLQGVINMRTNLIPPFLGGFDAWGGTSISDNGFVRVQGNDLLGEMIVSRLPVNDAFQTSAVVNKIMQYPLTFPQSRALNTLWISDNPDNDNPAFGTQFHLASEQTLAPLQPQFQVDRVYYCDPAINQCPADPWIYTSVADARAAVVNKWNQGHLLLHFTGHGSFTTWAHEQLFRVQWVNQLNNATALPFLLVSSCTNGYFASERVDGIDEGLLRAVGRGTIGGFTGVTFDTLPPQTELLTSFVEAVMHEGITQAGAAATVARARTYAALPYPENERSAVGHGLTGDPAMALIEPDTCAHGDVNCDGVIDIADVQKVAAAWNSVAWNVGYNPRTDLVRDGRIDIHDITAIVNLWHTPVP
jgi:hypothetical protein